MNTFEIKQNRHLWGKIFRLMPKAEYLAGYAAARAMEYVLRDGLSYTAAGKLMNIGSSTVKDHLNAGLAAVLRVKLKCVALPDRTVMQKRTAGHAEVAKKFYQPGGSW